MKVAMEDLTSGCSMVERIEALEQRILVLENKRPEYVPQPTIGPTKEYCNRCGNYVDRNHVCFASVK